MEDKRNMAQHGSRIFHLNHYFNIRDTRLHCIVMFRFQQRIQCKQLASSMNTCIPNIITKRLYETCLSIVLDVYSFRYIDICRICEEVI